MSTDNTLVYNHEDKILPKIFSEEEINKIFTAFDSSDSYLKNIYGDWMKARDKCICALCYYLALRPKEACSLHKDDYNPSDATLHIRGKNNKQGRDRIIPLCPQIIVYFQDYFSFPGYLWKGSSFLFPSYTNEFLSSGRWKAIFRRVLKEAGIWKPAIKSTIPPYRTYTLRHTRATNLADKTDIYHLANLLGHKTIRSTERYVHLNYLEKKELDTLRRLLKDY